MDRRYRRWRWMALPALCLAWAVAGCSSSSDDDGGGGTGVDVTYDFAAAGVEPGEDVRDSGRGLIRGSLTDAIGDPVADETVTLRRLVASSSRADSVAVGSATTDSDAEGAYVFGNVPAGEYRLTVDSVSQDVTVTANADSTSDFSGVGGGTDDPLPDPVYKWTMIVYLDADNDLEQYGIDDINEMERLAASDDVAIIVLMDRIRGYDTSNDNWTDARRFKVVHDSDEDVMTSAISVSDGGDAEVLGELDMGDPDTLNAFIDWAMRHYPAEHYLVDLWNHGAGWRHRAAAGAEPLTRGILYDDTSNNGASSNVETWELDAALDAPADIDIVSIDCSLMQMLEVAYEIRGTCDFVTGSEESPPGEGYPYDEIWELVVTDPDTTAEELAAHIVNTTAETVGTRESITQSALRTNAIADLATAVDAYADVLTGLVGTEAEDILNARHDSQRYGGGSSLYEGYRDLVDLLDNLDARIGDEALATAAEAVRGALTSALVAERHTGSSLADSHGLSIFAPSADDWTDLRTRYGNLAFAQATSWDELWDAVHDVN